jgi:hypothetical protein
MMMSDDIVKRLRAPTDDDGDLLQDAAALEQKS